MRMKAMATGYEWDLDSFRTGERIREYRLRRNLTQGELLDLLYNIAPVSRTSYCAWEKGDKTPTVSHFLALAYVFGCTLNDLIVTGGKAFDQGREQAQWKDTEKSEGWDMDLVWTGERIREIRCKKNQRQDQVLESLRKIGAPISKTSYSAWENGYKPPTLRHILALCRVFGCSPDELIVSEAEGWNAVRQKQAEMAKCLKRR